MRIRPGSECTSRGSSIAVIAVLTFGPACVFVPASQEVLQVGMISIVSLPESPCHNHTSTRGSYSGSFGGVSAELGDGDPFCARTPGGHGPGCGAVNRRSGARKRRAPFSAVFATPFWGLPTARRASSSCAGAGSHTAAWPAWRTRPPPSWRRTKSSAGSRSAWNSARGRSARAILASPTRHDAGAAHGFVQEVRRHAEMAHAPGRGAGDPPLAAGGGPGSRWGWLGRSLPHRRG